MTKDEALKMARTALGVQLDAMLGKAGHLRNDDRKRYAENGIKAIDEALAQPEQEPVAATKKDAVFSASIEFIGTLTGMNPPPIEVAPPEILKPFKDFTEKVCSIFAAPHPAQQEPVAWITKTGNVWKTKADETDTPLYTTPPQRKPLTDEEIETIAKEHIAVGTRSFEEFARRIEAAHGIKGEA